MKKRTFLGGLLATTMLVAAPVMAADWDGPTAGPTAAAGKSIVIVAGDLKNGGILGVTNGVEEAAAKIGWQVRVLDGAGSIQGRTAAIGQALARGVPMRETQYEWLGGLSGRALSAAWLGVWFAAILPTAWALRRVIRAAEVGEADEGKS